ncbi:hypothetical protein QAD02_000829 [Eretmocerus hayati]|uniref:Uncharacterized protein n=1 Tax=Eretmocerus hayati TaxID=131215 RepID=A0ACC2NJ37_9HYME|nr:hypothetical protein QAD02_000829 [Eretmocerus hayati]
MMVSRLLLMNPVVAVLMGRHKIFLIRGELPSLKEALEERGWIQKYEPSRTRSLPYGSASGAIEAKSLGDVRSADGTLNERPLTYSLLQNVQPDFIWDCRNDFHEWDRSIGSNVLLNRFSKPSLYTSKLGMAHVLQEAHWLHEMDVADVLFPRSYNPSRELAALTRDFQRCAALAVLRCFVDRIRNSDDQLTCINAANNTLGTSQPQQMLSNERDKMNEPLVSLDWIEFAIRCCEDHIAELEHEDIDIEMDNEISPEDWRLFTEDCEKYLYKPNGMANFPTSDPDRLEACYIAAQSVLEKLKNMDPQFNLNGEKNIWIVKPSNLCCGTGIFMTHDLKTILRKVESKPRDYYVVQKYIERPFLVYGTKFDIRQWFLVTSTFPMTIWSFREALLRLSSKPYTPSTYHEAIHLCNTAVQEKYDWDRRRRRNRAAAAAAAAQAIGGGGVSGGLPSTQIQQNQPNDEFEPTVRDQGWDCEKLNEYLK